ncbi:hypothetical protein SDC9_153095 [bioreactor metagenome]|uniref:Uncharacterized protein n=1 Tax=bioreactor metagenome TaxID=1076179 RepID=A0A645EUY3_9ZZZZ
MRAALSIGEGAQARPLPDVRDLQLLVFERRSGWQARSTMRHAGEGVYEARIQRAPSAVGVDLLVGSASQDLPFYAGALGTHVFATPRAGGAP